MTPWLCKCPRASANCEDITTIWMVVRVRATGSCKNIFKLRVSSDAAYSKNGVVWSSIDTPNNDKMPGCDAPYKLIPSCSNSDTCILLAFCATVLTRTSWQSLYVPRYTRPNVPSCSKQDKRTRHRCTVNSAMRRCNSSGSEYSTLWRGNVDDGAGGNTIDGGADGGCVCRRWKLDVRNGWPWWLPRLDGPRAQYAIDIRIMTNTTAKMPPIANVIKPFGGSAATVSNGRGSSKLLLTFSSWSLALAGNKYGKRLDFEQKKRGKKRFHVQS